MRSPVSLTPELIREQLQICSAKYKGKYNSINTGWLVEEQVLVNNQSSYIYSVTEGKPNAVKSEILLTKVDSFRALAYGLFLLRESATGIGTGTLCTYGNKGVFTESGVTPAHLTNLLRSQLKVTLDNNNIVKKGFNLPSLIIPDTQAGAIHAAATAIAASAGASPVTPYAEDQSEFDVWASMQRCDPYWELNGNQSIEIEVRPVIPASGQQVASATVGTDNKLVLMTFGILMTGTSQN